MVRKNHEEKMKNKSKKSKRDLEKENALLKAKLLIKEHEERCEVKNVTDRGLAQSVELLNEFNVTGKMIDDIQFWVEVFLWSLFIVIFVLLIIVLLGLS